MNDEPGKPQSDSPSPESRQHVDDDVLDEADLEAIAQSREQIARGEDMDWRKVSALLRRKHLGS